MLCLYSGSIIKNYESVATHDQFSMKTQWTFKPMGLQHRHHIDCILYAVHHQLLLNDRIKRRNGIEPDDLLGSIDRPTNHRMGYQ
jgi:hypothetical protein